MSYKYPVYEPQLLGNEKKYVNECLDTNWISSKGRFVTRFENEFSNYVGANYGVAVSNGTVGLHLALLALGIGDGDEVIVPTLTYVASVNSITYTGAKPVFIDSLQDTWQMNPDDLLAKITSKTKAVMVVHLYGHPCSMHTIKKIATDHNLFIIEDCAEAIGSKYNEQHVGNFGDVGVFSFYGNKTITTGEGGMVLTNDSSLNDRLVHLKGQGLAKYREYWHDAIGYNYRMTNICAAIGVAQLEQIDDILKKKKAIADWYVKYFIDSPFTCHSESFDVNHSYWMNSVLIPEDIDRDALKIYLAEKGIETRPLFYPVHSMPIYSRNYQKHPIAEGLARRGMNLPSYPALKQKDIKYIADSLKSFL